MSRHVQDVFEENTNALIGYLPLGFPTLDESIEAAVTLVENGVDILELGVPYSDPVMDGIVIQEATQIALDNGFKLSQAIEALSRITERIDAPVLLMTYFNPVIQYGVERFAKDVSEAGGAGLITPDLIPDEAGEWITASDKYNLDRVFLAAPTSTDDRLSSVINNTRGFVYAVSTMGTTGAREDVDGAAHTLVDRLRSLGAKNIGVGVGISTQEHVSEVLEYADAAIVGSALVKSLGQEGVDSLGTLALSLSQGKEHKE
jgi:tryptophan synthase alpha chain